MATTGPEPGTVEQELAAMRRICAALDQLDEPSRRRVMRYLTDRYPDANPDSRTYTPIWPPPTDGDQYATDPATPR